MSNVMIRNGAVLTIACMVLFACGKKNVNTGVLGHTGAAKGAPNEFLVLPQKPLEIPEDLSVLPVPTPGAGNRVDVDPIAEAATAFGGVTGTSGISNSERAFINTASRLGVQSNIRAVLRTEDNVFRKRHKGRPLDRLLKRDIYPKIYKEQIINPDEELIRMRRSSVWTPSAPPRSAE